MNAILRRAIFCCIGISLVIASGCGDDAPTNPTDNSTPWTPSTSTFDVTFTSNTVYFDSSAISSLVSADTANHRYVLNESNPLCAQLDDTKFIVLWRQGFGKVKSVSRSGGKVTVTTDTCTLDKIIKDGTMTWDYGVDFDPAKIILPTVISGKHGSEVMQPVGSDTFGIRLDYSDYIYKIALKLKGSSAYVKIGVEKKLLQGFRASFTAEGTIDRFRQKSTISFSGSQLRQFDHVNNGMQGDLKLSIAAAGSANDAINFEVPIVVAKYPVAVGPFLFFINVKIQVVANCVVPPDASSLIDVRFKYNSDIGFTFDGVNANAFGREGNESMEKDGNMSTASSSACAASFGIGFPRMELDLLGSGLIVPYVQPGVLIGGDFSTGIHPCMQGKAAFIGAAGVNMGFAGMTLKKSITLWNKEKILVKSGDCP